MNNIFKRRFLIEIGRNTEAVHNTINERTRRKLNNVRTTSAGENLMTFDKSERRKQVMTSYHFIQVNSTFLPGVWQIQMLIY